MQFSKMSYNGKKIVQFNPSKVKVDLKSLNKDVLTKNDKVKYHDKNYSGLSDEEILASLDANSIYSNSTIKKAIEKATKDNSLTKNKNDKNYLGINDKELASFNRATSNKDSRWSKHSDILYSDEETKKMVEKLESGESLTREEVQFLSGYYESQLKKEYDKGKESLKPIESDYKQVKDIKNKYNFEILEKDLALSKNKALEEADNFLDSCRNRGIALDKVLGISEKELSKMSDEELKELIIEKNPSIGQEYKRVLRSFDKSGYKSKEDFQKDYNEKEELYNESKGMLDSLFQQMNTAQYTVGMMATDYQSFKLKDNISDKNLQSTFNRDGDTGEISVNYNDYCKKFGDVSPYEFALESISKYGNDIRIDGVNTLVTNLAYASTVKPDYGKYFEYLYETQGESVATKYLKDIEEEVNRTCGMMRAQEFLDGLKDLNEESKIKAINEYMNYAQSAGKSFDLSFSGAFQRMGYAAEAIFTNDENRINSVNEFETMFISTALLSMEEKLKKGLIEIKDDGTVVSKSTDFHYEEDYGVLAPEFFTVGGIMGNMAPSMLMSTINPMLGSVTLGLNAGGGSYHEAMIEGHDKGKAMTYGVVSGISEVATEKLLGTLPLLSEEKVFSLKTLLKASTKEGGQEGIQQAIEDVTGSLILGNDFDLNETLHNMANSAKYGFITGGIMNSPRAWINSQNIKVINENVNKGLVSKSDIVDAMHSLIPETRNMGYDEIIAEYSNPSKEVVLQLIDGATVSSKIKSKVEVSDLNADNENVKLAQPNSDINSVKSKVSSLIDSFFSKKQSISPVDDLTKKYFEIKYSDPNLVKIMEKRKNGENVPPELAGKVKKLIDLESQIKKKNSFLDFGNCTTSLDSIKSEVFTSLKKFDLTKFYVEYQNGGILVITPYQTLGAQNMYNGLGEHGDRITGIYKMIYGDDFQFDTDKSWEYCKQNGNNIVLQLCTDCPSLVWLPDSMNNYQLEVLKYFNSEISSISSKTNVSGFFITDRSHSYEFTGNDLLGAVQIGSQIIDDNIKSNEKIIDLSSLSLNTKTDVEYLDIELQSMVDRFNDLISKYPELNNYLNESSEKTLEIPKYLETVFYEAVDLNNKISNYESCNIKSVEALDVDNFEFQKSLTHMDNFVGKNSEVLPYQSFKDAVIKYHGITKDSRVKSILENISKLDLSGISSTSDSSHYSPDDKGIALNLSNLDDGAVAMRELGYALHHLLDNNYVPSNYKELRESVIKNMSPEQAQKLGQYIEYYSDDFNTMMDKYKSFFRLEYYDKLYNDKMYLFKKMHEADLINLIKENYPDDDINVSNYKDYLNEYAKDSINNDIYNLAMDAYQENKKVMDENPGLANDIIVSLYQKHKYELNKKKYDLIGWGHDDSYYGSSGDKGYIAQVGDYFSLIASNNETEIQFFREVFGEEWYNMMEDQIDRIYIEMENK